MKKSKKVNPRRVPVTAETVKRAQADATNNALRRLLYLMLYILIDKHNAPIEDIQQLASEVNYYADSINKGYISWKDVERIVVGEYDVSIPW